MIDPGPDEDFRRFCTAGDTSALGRVFERLAPELLLVAAHLASGNVAEDLLQATFLDAIAQRERWDRSRPVAAWLCGILANHVLRARREQRRVPDPRRLPFKEAEGPHAAAEARELAEAVHAAVESLPLGYRQVLSLRLVHGFELQQIASSLGLPVGTVKTRLHRGVVLLRRALPAGLAGALAMALLPGRGLAAVREVVLSHASATAIATAGSGVLLGVLTMKKAVTFAAGAAVLALGAWGVSSAWPRHADPREPTQPIELRAQANVATPAVEPAQAAAATATPAAPLQRELLTTTGALEVDVVWSDGTAAAGIDVRTYLRSGTSPFRSVSAVTDASGRSRFADLVPGEYGVFLGRGRSVKPQQQKIEAGATTSCSVSIEHELQLEVQVIDVAERPQADAEVWSTDTDNPLEYLRLLGRTDTRGMLTHRCLSLSRIWARKAGSQPSVPTLTAVLRDEFGGTRSGRVQVRLVLGPAGCTLLGQVIDPQGHPVAGACVVIAQDESLSKQPHDQDQRRIAVTTVTDGQGRFTCDEIGEGEHPVQAIADGLAPATARVNLTPSEPATVTLQLTVGATVAGRVTLRDGTPIHGARIEAGTTRLPPGFEQFYRQLYMRSVVTDEEGRYRLTALRDGEHRLEAQADGVSEAQRRVEARDGETTTWDVTLSADSAIAGQVVDGDGNGLRGWSVRAMPAPSRNAYERGRETRATTDADGRFVLQNLPAAKYRVAAFAPQTKGAAAMLWRALVEDIEPPAVDLVLRVATGEGAWITGRITWPEGIAHENVELSLYPKERGRGGFFVPMERLPAGTDEFRIGPLPPGEYDLLCDAEGRSRESQRALRLVAGQTLTADFRLDLQQGLRLRLRHPDGRPAAGAQVRLDNAGVSMVMCKETNPGEYRSPPTAAGNYTAKVRGTDFAPFTTSVAVSASPDAVIDHTVPAGTSVHFRFRPPGPPPDRWVGALNVTVKDAQGAELVQDMLQIDGNDHFDWRLGLAPGDYTLTVSEFLREARKTQSVQVAGTAATPQLVEVQLEKH